MAVTQPVALERARGVRDDGGGTKICSKMHAQPRLRSLCAVSARCCRSAQSWCNTHVTRPRLARPRRLSLPQCAENDSPPASVRAADAPLPQPQPPRLWEVPWGTGEWVTATLRFAVLWTGFGYLALPLLQELAGQPLPLQLRATLQLPLELGKAAAVAQLARLCLLHAVLALD